jgi:hypothetical protein
MTRCTLLGVCLALLLVTSVAGSESDELREKAKAILKEAAALAEQGHKDEARQLRAKGKELLQVAEERDQRQKGANRKGRPEDSGPGLEKLEAHLRNLLAREHEAKQSKATEEQLSELREHIAATKAKIDSLRSGQKHGPDAGDRGGPGHESKQRLAEAVERLQHLRIAAEHLRAAGATELSQQVTEQAERMERDIRQAREHLARADSGRDGVLPAQVEELRREVQRLRSEVEELRRQKAEK